MEQNTNLNQNFKSPKDKLFGIATLFLLVATVFLTTLFIKEVNGKNTDSFSNISVSGSGEVFAVPDVALVTFSIREVAKTSKEAIAKMTEKETKALDFLKSQNIDKKDIKTLWFNAYPKYEYIRTQIICTPEWCPSSSGKQEIVGYEASETVQVKIRNIDTVGDIIDGITKTGIGEVNGPEFSVDDPDALKAEARKKAIEDAKKKAEVLRKDLGVRLVRIISYSEGGDYPTYYGIGGDVATMNTKTESSPAPNISAGEQKIISNITIVSYIARCIAKLRFCPIVIPGSHRTYTAFGIPIKVSSIESPSSTIIHSNLSAGYVCNK